VRHASELRPFLARETLWAARAVREHYGDNLCGSGLPGPCRAPSLSSAQPPKMAHDKLLASLELILFQQLIFHESSQLAHVVP